MKFGPEHEIDNAIERAGKPKDWEPEVPEHELKILEEKKKILARLFDPEIRAKFKVEVFFGKDRNTAGRPFAGAITLWLSGKTLNGGGDQKIWECGYCDSIVYPNQIVHKSVGIEKGEEKVESLAYCFSCGKVYKSVYLVGERGCVLTLQNWAEAIHKRFVKLGMDADIYLKYNPEDIRYRTRLEMARNRGGEELHKVIANRGLHIYPIANIIKDTKHGSSALDRIKSFISS